MRVDFWYDFASTYSYPAAMRIGGLAQTRGIDLRWRPFLLGPIFADLGWRNSPFNLFPVKGRYMWRDVQRLCQRQSLKFVQPDPFPQHSVLAARVALALSDADRPAFTRALFLAEFAEGRNIADRETIADVLAGLGQHPAAILEPAASDEIKLRLRRENDEAKRLGIFGAPTMICEGGEMFWGNDRLEMALDWAEGRRV